MKSAENHEEEEIKYLYKVANELIGFLEIRGFTAELSPVIGDKKSPLLDDSVSRCFIEVQIRTKQMDDNAEIGPANHLGYEKRQENERARRDSIPKGECIYFDEAYERGILLQQLQLNKLDVNMFAAYDNSLINDGCGLYRGRLILPYEHLSRFQNDLID